MKIPTQKGEHSCKCTELSLKRKEGIPVCNIAGEVIQGKQIVVLGWVMLLCGLTALAKCTSNKKYIRSTIVQHWTEPDLYNMNIITRWWLLTNVHCIVYEYWPETTE